MSPRPPVSAPASFLKTFITLLLDIAIKDEKFCYSKLCFYAMHAYVTNC